MIKIKSKFFVLLLIVLMSAAYAEDYSRYSILKIKTNLSSGLDIKYDDGSSVDYVNADVMLFPIKNYMQEPLSIDVFTNPNAKVSKGEVIGIKWENVDETNLDYNIISDVNVADNNIKIKEKVKFPIMSLDYDYLKYTRATEFIDMNDGMTNKAREIVNGEDDLYKAVFKIAEWVRTNINYTLDTLTEKAVQKSSWVFENKYGVCDEITNLFISMLRSQGIPARFTSGVVYSNVNDGFGAHGWAEVYFPGYRWVPFDVTFGQQGWIDTSHVVLKYSLDPGESSVDYSWRSRNIELNANELIVNADVINKGNELSPKVKIDINILKNNVGENSYVPVEVVIENLQDYYLSDAIHVTKAVGLNENNLKVVLLRPKEIKKVYWIVKIPNLDKGYKYEAVFEVKDNFNSINNAVIDYALSYKSYGLEQANELVSSLKEVEELVSLVGVELKCVLDKEYYYPDETADVKCNVKSNEENVKICLMNECKDMAEQVDFNLRVVSSGRLIVSAKKDDKIKYSYLDIKIIEVPNLTIKSVEPPNLDYKEMVNLIIVLDSDYLARNVVIDVDKTGVLRLDNIEGRKEIELNLNGINLLNGLNFEIKYKDEAGKEYIKKEFFDIKINRVPFLVRVKGLFLKWFNKI